MGKRKNALKRDPMKPWESATPDDCHEQYLRIGRTALTNPALTKLKPQVQMLYVHMAQACCGKKKFRFSYGDYRKRGYTTHSFLRARDKLIEAGIIKIVEMGNPRVGEDGRYTTTPNWYEWQTGYWQEVKEQE